MAIQMEDVKTWVKDNLFASKISSVLTVIFIIFIYLILSSLVKWSLINAVFHASSREECSKINENGACWAIIGHHMGLLIFGKYPRDLYIRPILALIVIVLSFVPWFVSKIPKRKLLLKISLIGPFVSLWFIYGGFGLKTFADGTLIGGFLLNIIIGLSAMILSIPIGTLLALGRRSDLPIIKHVCIIFIEFIRGVPIISLLFVAVIILKDFLPDWIKITDTSAVIFIFVVFESVYIAEVIRGGLQAVEKGQYEAGEALGLSYWQRVRLITLPQAFAISIPNIVNTFVNMFLDVTLVSVVGLNEVLGIGKMSLADATWQGADFEVYAFVAVIFFIICFSFTRFSLYLERKTSQSKTY